MSKTQIFIEKARAKHGDRYDYGRVVYVRNSDKIIITCKKHGDFEQIPSNHLKGYDCAKCRGVHRYSTQEWVQEARAKHGNRYDYNRVVYVGALDKVTITCKKHGDFDQAPYHHLNGHGCAKCGREAMAIKQSEESKNRFIERSRAVHGERYDYKRVVYIHSKDKVIITCAKHGDFEQAPHSHLSGSGCSKCSGRHIYSTQEWIQEAIAVHGDLYDYSKTVYARCKDKVTINCKIHGDFEQTPSNHLSGNGCPLCPQRYDQPTNLYLMHNGLGKVKVGYSIDIDKRITELNRDAPFEAELLESWTLPDTPTVRKIEGKVHRKLAKYHAGLSGFDGATEWFNVSPERAKSAINEMLIMSRSAILNHTIENQPQLSLF
ncbi:MAG TPA: GIY-YIG nuclease family protein [Pseudomonas sp.]|nr:GIY-YIG nuclease family protein [Pseudomonas sp.]